MLTAYTCVDGTYVATTTLSESTVWIDLYHPTRDEEATAEAFLSASIPTREDMAEIETSSRLYIEANNAYLTALVPSATDTDRPELEPVTFVLSKTSLVTLRYHDPKSISRFLMMANRTKTASGDPAVTMAGLLEVIVDRLADVLERIGTEVDAISRQVFAAPGENTRLERQMPIILAQIGRKGETTSTMRASLMSLKLLTDFAASPRLSIPLNHDLHDQLATQADDISSLLTHADFISQKTTFLLDAALGLIGMSQNRIIKFFSVVAAAFLPPTLIASIYGMNFDVMPELHVAWAYPMVMVVMLISALLPLIIFWKLKWL